MRALFVRYGQRFKFEGDAVHAIALAGRRRSVAKHVAQMAAAAMAMHFGARNHQTQIVRGADGSLNRCYEARPSGPAVEFGIGLEQGEIAARAVEDPLAMSKLSACARSSLSSARLNAARLVMPMPASKPRRTIASSASVIC